MTKQINEENIRVAAYYIWEQAGRPEGQEKECWIKACEQLFACNNKKPAARSAAKKPALKTAAKPAAKATAKKTAKPAVKTTAKSATKMPAAKASVMPLSDLNLKSANTAKAKKVFA